MLVLISPAKTLDFSNNLPKHLAASPPIFAKEALELVNILQNYSAQDLSKLMSISPKLGELNYKRFKDFSYNSRKPAIYAYKGDVYEGFELEKYTDQDINFANKTIRIISGLYGILNPLDLIAPYRLEMSINLSNQSGKNLYNFWQDKLTKKLAEEEDAFIINLASQEYSSAIGKLNKKKINIVFKEKQNNTYKIIGIHAKKARGVMANFIVLNRIQNPEKLKLFNLNGYKFIGEFSSEEEYVFVR
jgi:cytoplasmic iron level regulating protein YaaA (DUF328/UPF0246 family)